MAPRGQSTLESASSQGRALTRFPASDTVNPTGQLLRRHLTGFCSAVDIYDLPKARNDPDDPDHAEAVEYLDDYDPDTIDELPIKYALGRIAARRNAAKTRSKSTQ